MGSLLRACWRLLAVGAVFELLVGAMWSCDPRRTEQRRVWASSHWRCSISQRRESAGLWLQKGIFPDVSGGTREVKSTARRLSIVC